MTSATADTSCRRQRRHREPRPRRRFKSLVVAHRHLRQLRRRLSRIRRPHLGVGFTTIIIVIVIIIDVDARVGRRLSSIRITINHPQLILYVCAHRRARVGADIHVARIIARDVHARCARCAPHARSPSPSPSSARCDAASAVVDCESRH